MQIQHNGPSLICFLSMSEQHYSWEPRHSLGAALSIQNVLSRLMIPIQKIKVLKIMEDGIIQPSSTLYLNIVNTLLGSYT